MRRFRVWDKKTCKMSPPFDLLGEFMLIGGIHSWQHENGNTSTSSLEALGDLEVMQFIGRKDENKVDVYESDIVKVNPYRFGEEMAESWNAKIIYDSRECCYKIAYVNVADRISTDNINKYSLRVIGNFHQNPELL